MHKCEHDRHMKGMRDHSERKPHVALRQVARVFRDGTLTGLSDRQLLDRFVEDRAEAAFEAILLRHGPMVLDVCRRLLPRTIGRRGWFPGGLPGAGAQGELSVRIDQSLGPWLHAVAVRVAAVKGSAPPAARYARKPVEGLPTSRQRTTGSIASRSPASSMKSWPACRAGCTCRWCSVIWRV